MAESAAKSGRWLGTRKSWHGSGDLAQWARIVRGGGTMVGSLFGRRWRRGGWARMGCMVCGWFDHSNASTGA